MIDEHGLTDTGVTDKQNGRTVVEETLSEVSVTDGINSGYNNFVELLANWLVGSDLLFPAEPVLLFLVDVVFVDSVAVGEHGLDISEDIIDFTSAAFIDGGANGPNETEYEPLLNVEEVVTSVFFLTLLEAQNKSIIEVAEGFDTSNF